MLESFANAVISRRRFAWRVITSTSLACGLIVASLILGMLGYHYIEGMAWDDSFANAAMILSGMGPLGGLRTVHGKIFAGLYALYSGLVLVAATSIVVIPIVHRLLHRFHADPDLDERK